MPSPFPELTLSLGGLGIRLACSEPDWARRLAGRYEAFLDPQISPSLTVSIQPSPQPARASASRDEVHFEGGTAALNSQTYFGSIDPRAGLGEVFTDGRHPVEDIDYCLRVAAALLAFKAGGFLIHGAGIVHKERGYLFFGRSGVGKTTVSRLSKDDQVLNDDLVMLMPPAPAGSGEEGRQSWSIYATPFWNPTQVRPSRRPAAPLAGLFHLVQDQRVFLEPLSKGLALAELLACVPVLPLDFRLDDTLLERIERLQVQVPVYNLHFLPDPSFWQVIG